MKIVCFIQDYAPLRYFVNRIHRTHPVSCVVVEHPSSLGLSAKVKNMNVEGLLNGLQRRFKKMLSSENIHQDYIYNEYFGDMWSKIDSDISLLETDNINNKSVRDKMLELKPDIVLDHGTTIVRNSILDVLPLALNLHWGLSPYYRGTFCTNWALLNWDVLNIGVTIHKLSKEIDGGDILAQQRVRVRPQDTVDKINMRLSLKGTDLIIQALNDLMLGKDFKFHSQKYSPGFLTLNRQWNYKLNNVIDYIETHNIISKMIQNPSRTDFLPIIERINEPTSVLI